MVVPGSFSRTVTTAGTRVTVSSSALSVLSFTVQANVGNTGYIYVGASDVTSSNTVALAAGQSVNFPAIQGHEMDIGTNFYLDSSVNGEGAKILYTKVTL